jgi:hypothetical protein
MPSRIDELVDSGNNPFRIPEPDKLLLKLMEVHPDRRYEELKLKPRIGEAQDVTIRSRD